MLKYFFTQEQFPYYLYIAPYFDNDNMPEIAFWNHHGIWSGFTTKAWAQEVEVLSIVVEHFIFL